MYLLLIFMETIVNTTEFIVTTMVFSAKTHDLYKIKKHISSTPYEALAEILIFKSILFLQILYFNIKAIYLLFYQ